ncbi:MAG: hypothetical protein RIQ50_903 [Bacteroidota bacterium]|jgi:hypothetical protein
MRTLLFFTIVITLFSSCSKNESQPAPTGKDVAYDCKCTPAPGAVVTGAITYTTPTSSTNTASLANNVWIYNKDNWDLKSGTKLSVTMSVTGSSNCRVAITIDGAVAAYESKGLISSTGTPTYSITAEYVVQ